MNQFVTPILAKLTRGAELSAQEIEDAVGEILEGRVGDIQAAGFIVAPDLALDGVRSVFGRAALVHRDASDPAFPQHGAGPALACGVIR